MSTTTAPGLAGQVAQASNWPSKEFGQREQRLLQSVKEYVDGVTGNAIVTSQGDIIVGNTSGQASRLAKGSSGQVLTSNGTTVGWSSVTLASLAAGITPASVTKFAGTSPVTAAVTTQTLSIPGVLASDVVFVQMRTADSNNIGVRVSSPATDSVTVSFTNTTGTGGVLQYQVLRQAT